jgi:capsular exopolysaccharide synthesis family protein
VRALVSGPIVGTLPRLNPMQMRRMIAGETPPIAAEAYSLACANLMLALRHAWQDDLWHRQLVLITSAVPNEGKSITAAEVARFMARSGKSVILVDADMRRPTQRRLFNIDGEFGLADALVGDKQVADLMLDTDEPNLRLLPSGIVKKNPTALMSSPRLAETMNQLRELADVVIVDAPACAVVADAMLVAPLVDCIIQVVGAGVVSEKLVSETTEALRAAAPRTFAFIVNRAPNDRSRVYTPYYFKEYRGAANGNGHTSNDRGAYALPGVSNEEPQAPTSVAASNGANGANGAHTNGHSDHERIVIALPEDAGPTGTAPATDRSGSAS